MVTAPVSFLRSVISYLSRRTTPFFSLFSGFSWFSPIRNAAQSFIYNLGCTWLPSFCHQSSGKQSKYLTQINQRASSHCLLEWQKIILEACILTRELYQIRIRNFINKKHTLLSLTIFPETNKLGTETAVGSEHAEQTLDCNNSASLTLIFFLVCIGYQNKYTAMYSEKFSHNVLLHFFSPKRKHLHMAHRFLLFLITICNNFIGFFPPLYFLGAQFTYQFLLQTDLYRYNLVAHGPTHIPCLLFYAPGASPIWGHLEVRRVDPFGATDEYCRMKSIPSLSILGHIILRHIYMGPYHLEEIVSPIRKDQRKHELPQKDRIILRTIEFGSMQKKMAKPVCTTSLQEKNC